MSDDQTDKTPPGQYDRQSSSNRPGNGLVVREQFDPELTREKHVRIADKVEVAPAAKRFDPTLTRDKYQGPEQTAPKDLVTEQLDPALTRDKHRPLTPPRHKSDPLANLVKDENVAGMRPLQAGISGGENVNLDDNLVPPSTPKDVARLVADKGAPSRGQ